MAGLLATAMTAAMLSATALAAETGAAVTVRTPDGTETGYATLFEAADAAQDGSTLLLNQDVEMKWFERNGKRQNPTMLVKDKTLILEGQGHTVTANQKEAFSMIEVRPAGKLTLQNIVMDGSAAENRRYSNILNIEGGEVIIEKGTVLTNNCTAAVGIGTNVPGGKCTMNDGLITANVMTAGSSDTGVAVTVLEESTFIMNGGTISENRTEKYGSSGIMVNRGGTAVLNGGIIENNSTNVKGMASALHIKGGKVELNGTVIRNNTSANGYGAVYVTNHSSFGTRWDGVLDISGGEITGNKDADGTANAIYLWSKSSIKDTGAYLHFSGLPTIEGASRIFANGSDDVAFQPISVSGEFTPTAPVKLNLMFDYVINQPIVKYADGLTADSSHFLAAAENYGFQEDKEQNLLYTEARRKVVFVDGGQEIEDLVYWNFVEETLQQPEVSKPGYALKGWYTDKELTNKWNFESDVLPREDGAFTLYAKWSASPAEVPALPEEKAVELPCDDRNGTDLTPDFEEQEGYTYSYEWKDADGKAVGKEKLLNVTSPVNGGNAAYTLTVTAERNDNHETAHAVTKYTVSRATHDFDVKWTFDENSHWKECTYCKEKQEAAAHDFKWVTDKEASETENGSRHEECTVCGYKKAAVEIPATGAGTDKPAPDDNTDTGESGYPFAWALVFAGAGAAALLFGFSRKRQTK